MSADTKIKVIFSVEETYSITCNWCPKCLSMIHSQPTISVLKHYQTSSTPKFIEVKIKRFARYHEKDDTKESSKEASPEEKQSYDLIFVEKTSKELVTSFFEDKTYNIEEESLKQNNLTKEMILSYFD